MQNVIKLTTDRLRVVAPPLTDTKCQRKCLLRKTWIFYGILNSSFFNWFFSSFKYIRRPRISLRVRQKLSYFVVH